MPIGNEVGNAVVIKMLPSQEEAIFPLGPVAGVAAATVHEPVITLESLSGKTLGEIRKEPDVLLGAPEMPVFLIAPLDFGPVSAAQVVGDVTWGVRAVGANMSPFTGQGITVAILDTGVDSNHEAFTGIELIEMDFTGEGNGDDNGHGTHALATIIGRPVSGLRIGVAPGVSRALVGKVLNAQGSGTTAAIIEGIRWAVKQGADIISISIGIDFPGFVQRLVSAGLPVAAATAYGIEAFRDNDTMFESLATMVEIGGTFGTKPALLVAAAGNENITGIAREFEIPVALPASARGFISVGALAENGNGSMQYSAAAFSNTGPKMAAPGVGIISAQAGGGLASASGTSMATPHVAGVAALWAEQLLSTTGRLDTSVLSGRVSGHCTHAFLAAGFDFEDVGAGLVQAPQA